MVELNAIHIFSIYMYLSVIVFESHSSSSYRNYGCPSIQVSNGRVKLRSGGRLAKITCNRSFKLIQGNEIINCIRGQWESEQPICAKIGCSSVMDNIPHGRLITIDSARLEVECDDGYIINGPSFTYCNEFTEWNDELKGCKENDRIYSSCDFESPDGRFCGWENDRSNDVDWLADKKVAFAFLTNRRHVTPGSSQYFSNNYVSLDAGNYGSFAFGKLVSPLIPPIEKRQKCLIFSYKVIAGSSNGAHTLTVFFGNVPHWTTSEGEGKVIIGLYKFNITTRVIIEGINCKAAIDNIIITEGNSCPQKPYEDELDTCHDNCGKISYDDNSCSCDWECHIYNNCCSDISIKCPHIKPLEEIKRLYFTTKSTTSVTTTTKNTSNVMEPTTFSSTISNESKISTPTKEFVTVNKITNNITTEMPITHLLTTEKPTAIPKLNDSLNVNSTAFIHSTTNSKITTMSDLDVRPNITIAPTLMNTPNSSTDRVVTISVYNFNSTIKPSVMNSTYSSIVLNTSNVTKKSLVDSTFSKTNTINTFNSTTSSSVIDKNVSTLTSTTKIINTPSDITTITIPVNMSTTIPTEKKSIYTLYPTTQSSILTYSPNITTSFLTKNSINFTQQIVSTSTVKPFSSKYNESNDFFEKSLNVQNITKNDVITESNLTINNSTTFAPNYNTYTVSNETRITYDVDQLNLNLSRLTYETVTELHNYDNSNSTLKSNNSLFNNDSIPNETIISTRLNSDQTSNDHKKNDGSRFFSVSNVVIIVKYLAAIGIILITVRYSLSCIRWYFKKPIDDDMNSSFIKTDSEITYSMELKSHNM